MKRGDTLYSIALEHGADYREVAQWNYLDDPTKIRIGQLLRVTAPARRSEKCRALPSALVTHRVGTLSRVAVGVALAIALAPRRP